MALGNGHDAPVDGSTKSEDRKNCDVDCATGVGGSLLLVTRGDRVTSWRESRIDVLENDVTGQRVTLDDVVETTVVGLNGVGELIHRRVIALADREQALDNTLLTWVALSIAVVILEDETRHVGEPVLDVDRSHVLGRLGTGRAGNRDV